VRRGGHSAATIGLLLFKFCSAALARLNALRRANSSLTCRPRAAVRANRSGRRAEADGFPVHCTAPRANQAKVAKGAPVHRRHIVQWQKWTALGEVPQVHRRASPVAWRTRNGPAIRAYGSYVGSV
jgi:hypothetical protein